MFGTLFNLFDTEKRFDFFSEFFSPSALVIDALGELTSKKKQAFFASKKFAKFLSSVKLLASTNKTAHLCTLCEQFYLEKKH